MQKLLFRRTLRDLKTGAVRYLALFILVAIAMFIVVGIVGSAESIIGTVNDKDEADFLEDGQFGVFVPLTDEEVHAIEAMDVTLEACFYLDFEMGDTSALRVMQNREKINLIELKAGALAQNENEIVVERIYATAHQLSVGDTVKIGGKTFTISGIGTSPDYNQCLRNMSDMSSDGNVFGTAFVTPQAYDALCAGGNALHTEEYRYSYRLGNGVTDTDLKDVLLENAIIPDEVQDTFFQEMVKEITEDRDAMTDGFDELADGSGEISEALEDLDSGAIDLENGIQDVYSGLEQLNGNSDGLTDGSGEILSALQELEENAGELEFSTASIRELCDASAQLLEGIQQLNTGLQELSEQANYESFEAVLSQSGIDCSQLSPDAMLLLGVAQTYLTEVSTHLTEAADSAGSLSAAFETFDTALAALPDALEELNAGIVQFQNALDTLSAEYKKMDSGISDYTGGLAQLCNGADQLVEGANALTEGSNRLSENGESFNEGLKELQSEASAFMDEYFPFEMKNLTDFITTADNPRIKAANGDVEINIQVGIAAGIMVLILITYVISVFVVHSIDQESAMIGALYALGIKRKPLMLHYTMLPVVLCFLGGIAGTLLGYSEFGISMMVGQSYTYYSIPVIETVYNPYLLVYGLALPPLIACLVNRLVIRKRLSRNALSLLRNEQPKRKTARIQLQRLGFTKAFQLRQFIREKRSCFAVLAGMFVSLLILIMGINCFVLCNNLQAQNIADTQYDYMYQYKYPSKSAPTGGYPAYIESLSKEIMGYDMQINVIGLTGDNPFFPSITSNRKNEISVSSSAAGKYGLSVSDKVILSDEVNETEYGFNVKEIVPYSVGLCCFMDIDSMRTLFDQEDGYYNVVYSDHALDIDSGRLYAVSTRAEIVKSSEIFIQMMMPLMTTLIMASILIFVIVMYQMMKVMIDRSTTGISLMKIFGYRNREIRKLYLDGHFFLIAAGALIMIPIAKVIMDAIYPRFVANVACGTDLTWPPVLYVIVYAGILLCYLLIRTVLMRKLKKLTPAEVLKGRE